jgi:hypothetical protein|tara:strand:+ start:334 stop:567 length:234 start_codon:yes stop_codon:yes gene_type:complete
MRVVDLHTGVAQLTDALVQLDAAWGQVRLSWNDPARHHFESEHIEPITPTVRMTLDAINRLAEVLGRVERECTDEER